MSYVAVDKNGSEVMSYVAVDESKRESISDVLPRRIAKHHSHSGAFWAVSPEDSIVELPTGSIEKLIGRKLTWEDEPVELKETSIE